MQPQRQTAGEAGEAQRRLIQALRDPACYPHPVGRISVIETHISFVVLTGTFAYKIKKPVDLGFLDFTTLEKRRFFCQEELRLNARLAPQLYLAVVSIGGTHAAPSVGNDTETVEYALKMVEFAQDALADRMLGRGDLTTRQMDALAAMLAQFHSTTARAQDADRYGAPEAVLACAEQNFVQIRALPVPAEHLPALREIEAWTRSQHARLCGVFAQRKREGRVRECHGDLHLGNIAFLDGEPCAFDCIEFNADLRWIDVMNEAAFLVMDLHAAGRPDLARRFLNAYLESSGDYAGVRVLNYYFVYRAMVRAKIGLMRASQAGPGRGDRDRLQADGRRYLDLARRRVTLHPGFVVITHGFSGSGKTTLSQCLVELTGAVRIRSDVERKRMHGLSPGDRGDTGVAAALYSADVTDAVYGRLLEMAGLIVESGYGVIVDATFLARRHRDLFRRLANRAGVAFAIVDFAAPVEVLRERVAGRHRQGRDASDADVAVLEHQLATHEPLLGDERSAVFVFDAARPASEAQRPQAWNTLLQRLSPLRE